MLLQADQMHKMVIVVNLSVAQLVTTVIFFSAWDKSRVKWDSSRNSTQKMRTLEKDKESIYAQNRTSQEGIKFTKVKYIGSSCPNTYTVPVRLTSTSSKVSFSWFIILVNELLPTSVCLKSSTFILEHLTTNVPICWSLRDCKLRKLSFWMFVVKLLTK